MLLRELFVNPKKHLILSEGGNLASHDDSGKASAGWQGMAGVHQAEDLDLEVHNRTAVLAVLNDLMININNAFSQQYGKPIWPKAAFASGSYLSGSSFHFFDKKIPDEQFVKLKPKVGDIDTQAPVELDPSVKEFLTSMIGKQLGSATFVGFKPGNNQYSSMWEVNLEKLPVKLQIDFEFGKYDPATEQPDEWYAYSHSSHWDDIQQNIKGVFHKYLNRAMPYAQASTKYVARVLKKSTKISPEPVTDADFSFAVSGGQGGGLSRKYVPYMDPATGEPMVQNGIPVMQLLEPKDRAYDQSIGSHFQSFFGHKPSKQERAAQDSFVGTVGLIAKNYDDTQKTDVVNQFLDILFEKGSQMITKNDPARDRKIKFAAIDYMLEHISLPNEIVGGLRERAVQMSKNYEQDFLNKNAAKQPLAEAEVAAKLRKGMPHLRNLPPADLLDLLDEIHDGNGNFKIQNIPLNVKVDGFGGRFGKNADGKPFMGTSRTPPRYEANFAKYHQEKGTTDPEILGRAQLFDKLFEEMMKAVELVDSKLGPEFLVNKQVTCEVLFLPFATETPEGKLKFVGIHYDKLPEGVELALVPFHVSDATSGDDIKNSRQVVKALTELGQQGSVMFINNALTQNGALDVTGIVPPLENVEELKAMLASKEKGINDRKRQVAAALQPVAVALEKAIISDPNIIGKDMLGKDYEGIVLNTRLGPIKVTSAEQRQVVANKQDAITAAREARKAAGGAQRTRTAVITAGSFVGHKGHEQLVNLVLDKADEVDGDAFVYISPTVGPDDPIPPEMKLATWQKLYPERADMFQIWQEGGSPVKKIEKELVLPPDSPYNHIILMVGSDRYLGMKKWMDVLAKRMKDPRYPGSHNDVTFETIETKREEDQGGTGITFTQCRKALSLPDDKALNVWTRAFDVKKLGVPWIKKLMNTARAVMKIKPPTEEPAELPVSTEPVNTPQEIKPAMPSIDKIDKDIPAPIAAKLKERRLAEQVREMERAINEAKNSQGNKMKGKTAPLDKEYKASMKNMITMPDQNSSTGSSYLNYRMGIALAGAPDYPTKMAGDTWLGGDPLLSTYTPEELEMVKKASLQIGGGKIENWSGKRSQELPTVNKTSTVAKRKKNQYGV